MSTPLNIVIPPDLLPDDGRFGSGPSKVRTEALDALAATGALYMGTSHRQPTVQFMVAELRNGLAEMFAAPDGYEILLGNGGATCFWDVATFGLINERSHHLSLGEFSSKFVNASAAAPHLGEPSVSKSEPGTRPAHGSAEGADAYCFPHNETSTGVMVEVTRPTNSDALTLVDATSGAGGLRFDPNEADVYYFAPQKCLAADGGLWIAMVSPAAIERIEAIHASGRWIPASLDLKTALDNSRKDQTYNTPALATVFLASEQVRWVNDNGGLNWAAGRSDQSADTLYSWAEANPLTTPFVADPDARSRVVATIDVDDAIDATTVSSILRSNGIVDTDSYRKLGRNQIRIAMFPAIDPSDVEALTGCLDYVFTALAP